MSYYVFDMDETLAELYSVYYFLDSLKTENQNLPGGLADSLEKAYTIFTDMVYQAEVSTPPLGILRPGILDIMSDLHRLQESGKVKCVVIYSNNGHLPCLEFIRDLIHRHIRSNTLIKDCIHRNHPARQNEIRNRNTKTWEVLKSIIVNGPCNGSPNLDPKAVHFFDDLEHPDLRLILGNNYHKVPAYEFKASFELLEEMYKMSLLLAEVDTDLLYNYLYPQQYNGHKTANKTANDIVNSFRENTHGTETQQKQKAQNDRGIKQMKNTINMIQNINPSMNPSMKPNLKGGRNSKKKKRSTRKKYQKNLNPKTAM